METDDVIVGRLPKRFRAHFVITASIVIQFTNGLIYTFGNILPYLVSYLRWEVNPTQSRGSVLWLQSMLVGLPFSMVIGGYLEKATNARIGALIGTTLYSGGIALSYFTIQMGLPYLILTLGLCSSMGLGISYNCVLIQSQKWMPTRVGLASGLIAAGFGSSAFLVSPLQTKFINPDNLPANSDGIFTQVELLERVPKMFLMLAALFASLQFVALFFIAEPKAQTASTTEAELEETTDDRVTIHTNPAATDSHEEEENHDAKQNGHTRRADEIIVASQPGMGQSEALTSTTFFILTATFLLNGMWVQTISGFYKTFGQTFIHDDFFLSTIISFAAATNCMSRVLWGQLADKTSYQTSMIMACGFGSFLMWSLTIIQRIGSPMLYMIWVCMMFICVGATFTLIPYGVHRCFGASNFGIVYGFTQLGMAAGGAIVATISQFALPYIGMSNLFIVAGGAMFTSLLISLAIHRTKYGAPVAAAGALKFASGARKSAEKNGSATPAHV